MSTGSTEGNEGKGEKRLFICPVVKVMNVMLGRGLLELLPLYGSDLKLKHDADIRGPSGSSVQLHTACVFMPTDEYMQDEQQTQQ